MEKEIWKDIKGYEGVYQVSNLGRVKSLSRFIQSIYSRKRRVNERIMRGGDQHGYLCVQLYFNGVGITHRVHRLVAEAFIPNPNNKPGVNHKNGVKTDNQASNLEWMTAGENTRHAVYNNFPNKSRKLNYETAYEIRTLYKSNNYYMRELAEIYGVHKSHIERVLADKVWI